LQENSIDKLSTKPPYDTKTGRLLPAFALYSRPVDFLFYS